MAKTSLSKVLGTEEWSNSQDLRAPSNGAVVCCELMKTFRRSVGPDISWVCYGLDCCGQALNTLVPLGRSTMTTFLVAMRAAIIWWVSVSLMPIEVVYDAIESELERRDVLS
jgi:hypothetical protein